MKRGGQVIYGGKIGNQSSVMISYFQVTLPFSYFSYNFLRSRFLCVRIIMLRQKRMMLMEFKLMFFAKNFRILIMFLRRV